MRKFLLMLLMISSLCISTISVYAASAETPLLPSENLDSIKLTEKEKNDLQIKSSDTAIRMYNSMYTPFFAEGMSIDEILTHNSMSYIYMIKSITGKIRYMHYWRDGNTYKITNGIPIDWSDFYRYAVTPHLVLDSTIQVKAVYCLHGEANYDGAYIYYVTNQGDYILYREYASADAQYLIPVQELYGIAKKVVDSNKETGDELLYGGSPVITELCDLSAYQVPFQTEEATSFPWGWVAAGAAGVLMIGGTAIALLYKKKKKTSQE